MMSRLVVKEQDDGKRRKPNSMSTGKARSSTWVLGKVAFIIVVIFLSSLAPLVFSSWILSSPSTLSTMNLFNDDNSVPASVKTGLFTPPSSSSRTRIVILAVEASDESDDGVHVAVQLLRRFLVSPSTELRVETVQSMAQWQRVIQGKEVIFQGDTLFIVGHGTKNGRITLSSLFPSSAAASLESSALNSSRMAGGVPLETILKVSATDFRQNICFVKLARKNGDSVPRVTRINGC